VSERVAVLLLTGAPGSGKTTLLARWLVDPEFSGSALVVNELGEVAIDVHLVRGSSGPARVVTAGCLCCSARGRFAAALEALVEDRLHRRVPAFTRVIVEASGLADPVVIEEELRTNPFLRNNYRLEGVVTAVDASQGAAGLDSRPEALAQAARADALIVTKTDIASAADVEAIEARLAQVNRHADVIRSVEGNAQPQMVMAAVHGAPTRVPLETRVPASPGESTPAGDMHGDDLRAFTLRPQSPMDPEVLRSRLETFLERHGAAVLRLKGMVAIEGHPGAAVVQAVGADLYPVRLLTRWPADATAAVVVLARGLAESDALAAIEDTA
jgi:G3E family GTPase